MAFCSCCVLLGGAEIQKQEGRQPVQDDWNVIVCFFAVRYFLSWNPHAESFDMQSCLNTGCVHECIIDATREHSSYSFSGGIERTKDLFITRELEGYPSTNRFPLPFFVVFTRQPELPGYPGRRVTVSLFNTPGMVNPPTRVNFLLVFRPFTCNRALSCPGS